MDFECSTVCPTLPGLMGIWQKQLGSWARWWNTELKVTGHSTLGTSCRYVAAASDNLWLRSRRSEIEQRQEQPAFWLRARKTPDEEPGFWLRARRAEHEPGFWLRARKESKDEEPAVWLRWSCLQYASSS